jgi:hypothetical protein
MKDLSASLAGLVPALILWRLGAIEQCVPQFFCAGAVTVAASLSVYYILRVWQHPALLTLLGLGIPLMFYVYVAVLRPIFLPLFYGAAGLILLASCTGALVTENWTWTGVGSNIAFFCTVLLLVLAIGRVELVYTEAGLLAAGAFGITRLCDVDLLSWCVRIPRWVYSGLEKLWS